MKTILGIVSMIVLSNFTFAASRAVAQVNQDDRCGFLASILDSDIQDLLEKVGFWKIPACSTNERQENFCGDVAQDFHDLLGSWAGDSSWEKNACLKNDSAKGLFSDSVNSDAGSLASAKQNYCTISPGWRICFVCNVVIGKNSEPASEAICAKFDQPDDKPNQPKDVTLIGNFDKQMKKDN